MKAKPNIPFQNIRIKKEPVFVEELPAQSCSNGMKDSSPSAQSDDKVKDEPNSTLSTLKQLMEMNVDLRESLKEHMKKIKANLAINVEKQATLKKIIEDDRIQTISEKPQTQIRAISVFASPYFRDVKRMVPPLNEDAIIKRKNRDVNAYLKPPTPWTPTENKNLLDGVTSQALLKALQPLKRMRDSIKRKLLDQNATDSELEVLKEQLSLLEEDMKTVKHKPLQELLQEVEGKIDWMTVSATNMQGTRSPEECENMWNNYLDFKINKEAFTEAEDNKLFCLAEDYKEKNWDTIAAKLETCRTAVQCFERYQTQLSKKFKRKFWTKEEDDQLKALVEEHKCGEIIPWNKLSLLMEGRTRQQIINRYERSVSQQFNRGPWTPEEDALLIACFDKYGNQWARMKFFKRRSTYSIRERYCNALDPALKSAPWSLEEDRLLIQTIRKYGYGKWSKIAKSIPGRTDNMCLMRANRILEASVKWHSDNGREYDPGTISPEVMAKILVPAATSKQCKLRHSRANSYRINGIKMLIKALQVVMPDYKAEEDLNEINFKWMSLDTLRQVSEVLHQMLQERTGSLALEYKTRYFTSTSRARREAEVSDDEEEITLPPEEEKLSKEEKEFIFSVLHVLFNMSSRVMMVPTRKSQVFNAREMAEMALYKAYLYKQLHCMALCDEEDDIENVTFAGIDYAETMQIVVSFFIQPPIYENQFIVLQPNTTTMIGMEVIGATEDRLLSMSECVSHSKNYLDYVCNRRQHCPQCLQCIKGNDGAITPKKTSSDIISDMKKKLFIVDESMEVAAYVEGASTEKIGEACSCAALAESRDSVQLLRKRFMALFLWPALLSSIDINKEQETIICTTNRPKNHDYFLPMVKPPACKADKSKRRKRKRVVVNSKGRKRTKYESVKQEASKPRQKYRKKEPPAVVTPRRSTRKCVLNRTTFSYSVKSTKKPSSSITSAATVPLPETNSSSILSLPSTSLSNEVSTCVVPYIPVITSVLTSPVIISSMDTSLANTGNFPPLQGLFNTTALPIETCNDSMRMIEQTCDLTSENSSVALKVKEEPSD